MLFQKDIYDGYIKKIDRKKKEVNENKKERKRSLKKSVLQFPPISGDFLKPSEKVSFCTFLRFCRRASLAVETALVLPLFFLGMVTMISFMDIYQIQTLHLQKLCENTKDAGMYAYVLDGKGPDKVTLPDVYSYTPVGGLIPLSNVWKYHNCPCMDGSRGTGKFRKNREAGRNGVCNRIRFCISQKTGMPVFESVDPAGCRFRNLLDAEQLWREVCSV